MDNAGLQLLPGEEVILKTQPGSKWYHLLFHSLLSILLIGGAVAGSIEWVRLLEVNLSLREIEPRWIFPLTQLLYLAVIPALVIAWRVEAFIKIFTLEVMLTNQRILLRSTPRLWSRVELDLEQIDSLSPEGLLSRVRFRFISSESAVYEVPGRDEFLQAFAENTSYVPGGEGTSF